jgi:hypothetical protein
LLSISTAAVAVAFGAGSTSAATPEAPSACTGAQTRSAVSIFVTAYNKGDYETLDGLFAMPSAFQWYSSYRPGSRLGAKAKRRDNLISYFRGRHRAGDRLGLTSFQFNGSSNGYGNFGIGLRRVLPGFRDGDWFRTGAKGAALCEGETVQLVVMTLGGPEPVRR